MTLLDQFNRPIKVVKAPDRTPMAAAPILDSTRDYVSAGLTPAGLAGIFRDADAGDVSRQAQLFDQIEEKDGHLQGEISKRKNVILDADITLAPADDSAQALKIFEFVETWMDNMADWPDTLVALQDAVGKGFSSLETLWDVSAGQAVPTGFEFIEQKRFVFTNTAGYLSKVPRLLTDADPMGVEIPAWKTVLHTYGGKSGNATRSAIYRVCAWMYLFKNFAIKDWVIFSEVYGMPLRLGKYDPGATKDDKAALRSAISSLGTDAAGIISKSTEIEFVESVRGKASGDLYAALADFANREMSKAIIGATLTSDVGASGSRALGDVHNEVRHDLKFADARALAVTVRSQVIRPLVGFNFGWDAPLPVYKAERDEDDERNEKAEWVDKLLTRGLKIGSKWLRSEFKIPEPEPGEETVGGVSGPDGSTGTDGPPPVSENLPPNIAKFMAGERRIVAKDQIKEPDAADVFAARLSTATQPATELILDEVRALVAEVESLEELNDRLAQMFGPLSPDAVAGMISEACAASRLAGMSEVADEVDNGEK
jgi:phage gp29-like protein